MTHRCHQWKKMMGRGADGGCGTQEKPCLVSRIPPKTRAEHEQPLDTEDSPAGVDLFAQARKVLSQRSPFDVEDGSAPSVLTLPSGLGGFLSKNSDSRKRQRKPHAGDDAKILRQGRGPSFWVEAEEYFREVTVPDIEILFEASAFHSLASQKYLSIPLLGSASVASNKSSDAPNKSYSEDLTVANANVVASEDGVNKEGESHLMEIDSVGTVVFHPGGKTTSISSSLESSSNLKWLLCSRNRVLLASERPSKKRKLLGKDAGLDKLLVACPCEGNLSLCHFCSRAEMDEGLDQLIVCSLCKMSVHRKCYGVQDNVIGSWLCSWCTHRIKDGVAATAGNMPCVLCPKHGGALKPVLGSNQNEKGWFMEFAHLFCSLWIPELHIKDIKMMEPIVNIDGIKESRRKLICNVCRVKWGACVRCSNGACRTSFHPICAREARHRLEIWGKYGCDNVELRVFCSKHSEVLDGISNSYIPNNGQLMSANRTENLKISCKTVDESTISKQASDDSCLNVGSGESQEAAMLVDAESHVDMKSGSGDILEGNNHGDVARSNSLNLAFVLKKLIDQGKVRVEDAATELGVEPELLAATLCDNPLTSKLTCGLVNWFKNHAYLGSLQKNLKVKFKPSISSECQQAADGAGIDSSDSHHAPIKLVPPRRKRKTNIRILKDNKLIHSSRAVLDNDSLVEDKVDSSHIVCKDSILSTPPKVFVDPSGFKDSSASLSPKPHGDQAKHLSCGCCKGSQAEGVGHFHLNALDDIKQEIGGRSVCNLIHPCIRNGEASATSYIHPVIQKKLLELHNSKERGKYHANTSSSPSDYHNFESQSSACICINPKYGLDTKQLMNSSSMEISGTCPEDEVEEELIYFQHTWLCSVMSRKQFSDDLIFKVVKNLPQEMDSMHKQRWESVLVNQYLRDLREAKKQGRKERKHKEAQAVLAAATAAAAASSRISSFRKVSGEEAAHREYRGRRYIQYDLSGERAGVQSQLIPRPKETLVPRGLSEKQSDFFLRTSELSGEHPRSCDICRRPETVLNLILICFNCKVTVHLDCYRSIEESTGPWYCELCEDLFFPGSPRAASVNTWEKSPFFVECGICGGATGAFRKSTDGQWVHAFCAEWVFKSTYRRGQTTPVEGMESILKGNDVCCICRQRKGVCIKCNYGHCQSTFHPSCARNAAFYMNDRSFGGKFQHKAYCERHSLEQRLKAETQKHGVEELKNLKQIRVELERLRLLCERITKREKLKREMVLCSHEIFASKRDSLAFSMLVRSPFFPPEISSESATTSLKGHMGGYKSGNDTIQRSDDMTVDSTISAKHCMKNPLSIETDQKTEDSSTSQHPFPRKPMQRVSFSGKQIPRRYSSFAGGDPLHRGDEILRCRKHPETFEKELVMTSDQASIKNQRLPKGFVYVPIDCLSEQKLVKKDACSPESPDPDG